MREWTAEFAGFEILLLCSMDRAHVSGRSRLPAEPSPAATFATFAGRAIHPTAPDIAAATFPPRCANRRAQGGAAALACNLSLAAGGRVHEHRRVQLPPLCRRRRRLVPHRRMHRLALPSPVQPGGLV